MLEREPKSKKRTGTEERAIELHNLRIKFMEEEHNAKMRLLELEREYLVQYQNARIQALYYYPQFNSQQQN